MLSEPNIQTRCSYKEFVLSLALLQKALKASLDNHLYSTTLPAYKRLCELACACDLYTMALAYSKQVEALNPIFAINALAWEARFARLQGQQTQRMELLQKRLEKS